MALWPIVFASKRMTSADTHYSNNEREALGNIAWPRKILSQVFCQCENRPQTAGHLTTEVTQNIPMHPPVQNKNTVQILNTAVHSRLAVETQPQDK